MGKAGMSDLEIEQFVDYFWKALHPVLFVPALIKQRQAVDLVIDIDVDHLPCRISGLAQTGNN